MSHEFEVVSHELKAGKDKASVLKDMADRSGVQDIRSFVTVLVQSQKFGTSIAEALRVHASGMRDKRVMRAEESRQQTAHKDDFGHDDVDGASASDHFDRTIDLFDLAKFIRMNKCDTLGYPRS